MTTTLNQATAVGATTKAAHAWRRCLAPHDLHVGTLDGQPWVSNGYWLAPLTLVRPLWTQGDVQPGRWELGRNDRSPAVELVDDRSRDFGSTVPDGAFDETRAEDVDWVGVDGHPVHTERGARMFRRNSEQPVEALNLDYVRLLAQAETIGNTDRYDDTRWQVTVPHGSRVGSPVTVWRAVRYVSQTDGPQSSWAAAGILMPVRVGF